MTVTKKILAAILATLLSLLLTACAKTSTVTPDSKYLVIHSRMLYESGGMFCIDENGEVVAEFRNTKMMDLSDFSFDGNRLLISGGRKNNNMLFPLADRGEYSELNWLGDKRYSGVCAVTLNGDSAIAVMNGNFDEGTYLNLFVHQNLSGEVLGQCELEIFARDVIVSEGCSYIAGAHIKGGDGISERIASIIVCDVESATVAEQIDFGEYRAFWSILDAKDSLWCAAEGSDERICTLVEISKSDLSLKREIKLKERISDIFIYNDRIFALTDKALYGMNGDEEPEEVCALNSEADSYVDSSYVFDGALYTFLRNGQRVESGKTYEYGKMVKTSLADYSVESTPIKYKKTVTMDKIFVFAAEMFGEKP